MLEQSPRPHHSLSIPDVARRLGKSPRMVRDIIARGELRVCYEGKRQYIERGELEIYLHKRGHSAARIAQVVWDMPV